jgi:hypothetical protein
MILSSFLHASYGCPLRFSRVARFDDERFLQTFCFVEDGV